MRRIIITAIAALGLALGGAAAAHASTPSTHYHASTPSTHYHA